MHQYQYLASPHRNKQKAKSFSMPQYFAFLPVLVATGWLLSSKAKIIENSSRPKAKIGVVIVSAISFLFGLQISHLTALFQTDSGVGVGGFMESEATK